MIKVGILGGSGYTAFELMRLLSCHPQVEQLIIASRRPGRRVGDVHLGLASDPKLAEMRFVKVSDPRLYQCDVVFLAMPSGQAMRMVPQFLEKGMRVIDLSADFRLRDIALWEKWYGMAHANPDLLDEAVYGLPELDRSGVSSAQLIACPGCYPTAALLAIAPLLNSGLIDHSHLIINGVSGVSGAGRRAEEGYSFSERAENFSAYAPAGHRHLPEIEQQLTRLSGSEVRAVFLPHLAPMQRGIHMSIYARLSGIDKDLQNLFEDYYRQALFVTVLPQGETPQTAAVRSGNACLLSQQTAADNETLLVMATLDNLVKGASGQAVQCMNLMFGLDEASGLSLGGLLP